MLLLALGAALSAAALLASWAQLQLLDTNSFSTTSAKLLDDGAIRDALSRYLVAEVDNGSLSATQRRQLRGATARVLESAQAKRTWQVAAEDAHRQLVTLIHDRHADAAQLNLRPLIRDIARQLRLPDPINDQAPAAGRVTVLTAHQLRGVRTAADSLQRVATVLVIATLLVLALAVALAANWRRGALAGAALAVAVGAGVVLIARSLVGDHVVSALVADSSTRDAAGAAWSIGTSLLATLAIVALVAAAIVIAAAAFAPRPTENPLGPPSGRSGRLPRRYDSA